MRHFISILLLLLFSMQLNADNEHVVIMTPKGGIHSGIPFVPVDMPSVYYDVVTQEIIINGNGYSAYYDVDIISESTLLTVLSANVDGDYDTIDVSSLPDDNYTIVITSSNNNEYTGQFTNY